MFSRSLTRKADSSQEYFALGQPLRVASALSKQDLYGDSYS